MNVIKRAKEPTPKFFKKLMALGASLLGVSTAILAAPNVPGFIMPHMLTTIAGYTAVAGVVLTAISKITVNEEPDNKEIKE